jgi:hypothetical protein
MPDRLASAKAKAPQQKRQSLGTAIASVASMQSRPMRLGLCWLEAAAAYGARRIKLCSDQSMVESSNEDAGLRGS